ncbi:2-octaprenyl-6-methoxyphenyl hydroxylase [Pseudohongiella spirulinae]|uniref:2-octaprenyl-6-methoxyphenyl hydroxylase n=1 Tax=Pseudohongiella spirulinae TaxID=1249552 RepID=A0A0S2K9S4_9GAMM|nr:2-octaprenyl-6-methoxyphenyl hydroxylase [Pseudohongiella spirulinae]ALO44819.1 2-octaprenyl-6-methoxyphenyl hydroxylase [Pseudohongiella spirulinae]
MSYDIVIAGGGLVGGSFALMLAAGLTESARILLVDTQPLAADDRGSIQADFDARSTALSWGSRQIYDKIGLWGQLAPYACAINDIHVSDRGHPGAVRLHNEEMGVEALGYVLENQHLSSVINQALGEQSTIEICAPATVSQARPTPDGMAIQLQVPGGQKQLNTRLLVLADGGRSGLCEQLGIQLDRRPYQQQALVCNVAFEKDHQGQAFERFTDTGPMAILPLNSDSHVDSGYRGALVWTLAEDSAADVLQMPDDEFLAALQQRFGWRLGSMRRVGRRALYPLALTLAQEQIRPGLVLLGNVAHTLHPVAGQGLNLALRDASALAKLLTDTINAGESAEVGAYARLEAFQQAQDWDQRSTVMFSDLTTRLFSNSQPALVTGRNLGLLMMDLMPPARRWFARQAMGLR